MLVATRPGEASSWGMVAMAAAYCSAFFLWVRKFRIEIGDGTITYESLFGGSRQVRVADIESVNAVIAIRKRTDRFQPPLRLVLRVKDGVRATKEVTINLKVFELSDVATLMEAVDRGQFTSC
jgi:hypothetical protein